MNALDYFEATQQHQKKQMLSTPLAFHGRSKLENDTPIKRIALSEVKPNQERLLSTGARRVIISTPQKENHLPIHPAKGIESKTNYMKPTQAYKNALEDLASTPKRLANRKTTFSHRTPATPGQNSVIKLSKKSKPVTPQDGVFGTPKSKSIARKDVPIHGVDEERKKQLNLSPHTVTPTRIARPQSAPKMRPESFNANSSPHHATSVTKNDTESVSTARSNSRLRSHQTNESNHQNSHTILFSPPRTNLGTPKTDTPRNQTPRSQSAPKPRPSPLNFFKHESPEGDLYSKRQQFDSPQVPMSDKYMEVLSPQFGELENPLTGRKANPIDPGSKAKISNKMKPQSSAYHSQAPPITANKLSAFKAAKQAIMAKAKNTISTSSSFARYSAPTFAAHIRNREQQQSHAHLNQIHAPVGINSAANKPISRPTPTKDAHSYSSSSSTATSHDTRVRSLKGVESNGDAKFRDIAIKVYEDDLFEVVKAMETPKEAQQKQYLFTSHFRKTDSPVSNGGMSLVRQPSTHSIMSLGSSTYDPLYDIPSNDISHKYQPSTSKAHYFLHEDGVEYSAIESPHVPTMGAESSSPSMSTKLNQALISIPSIDRASLFKQDDESSQSIWINPSLSGSTMYPTSLRLQESMNQESASAAHHPTSYPSAVYTKDVTAYNVKTKSFETDLSSVPDCENHIVADEVSFQESFDGSIKIESMKFRQKQQPPLQNTAAPYRLEMHLSNDLVDVSRVDCAGSFSPHSFSESFASTFGNESVKSMSSLRESFGRKSLNNRQETSFPGAPSSHIPPSTKTSNAVLSFEDDRICSNDDTREVDCISDSNGNRDERYLNLSVSQINNSGRAGIPPLRRSSSNQNKSDIGGGTLRNRTLSLERQNSVPDDSLLEDMTIFDEDHIKPMYESEVQSVSMLDYFNTNSSKSNNVLDTGVLYTSSGSGAMNGDISSMPNQTGINGSMNSTGIQFISPSLEMATEFRTPQQEFDAVDRHIVTNFGSRSMEDHSPAVKGNSVSFPLSKANYMMSSPASLMYELSGNDRSDLLVSKMKTPTSAPSSQLANLGSGMKSPFFSFQKHNEILSKSIEIDDQHDEDDSSQYGIGDLLMFENPSSPHVLRVENADQVNRGDDGSSGEPFENGSNTDFDGDCQSNKLNTAILVSNNDESNGTTSGNSALFSFNDFASSSGRDHAQLTISNAMAGTHSAATAADHFSMPKLLNSSFDFELRGNSSLPVPINIAHHSKKSTTFQAIEEQQLSLRLSSGQISGLDIRKQKQSSPVSLPTKSCENMTLSTILPIGEDDSIVTEGNESSSTGEKDALEESIGTLSMLLESKEDNGEQLNYYEINDRYQAVLNGISMNFNEGISSSSDIAGLPLPPPVSITSYRQQLTQTMPPLPPSGTRTTTTIPVQTTTPLALFSRSLGGFLQDESSMLSVDESHQLSAISETLTNSQSSYSSSMEELGKVTGKSPLRNTSTNITRETIALLLHENALTAEEIGAQSCLIPSALTTPDEIQCYDPLAKQLFTNSHRHLRERNVKCLEKTFVPVDTSDIDHSS